MRLNPKNSKDVFNLFDDRAMLVGLERRELESNILLHNRIVNKKDADTTQNGLAQWILDAFEEDQDNYVANTYIFLSQHIPLSYAKYNEIIEPDVDYVSPSVYDYTLDETFSFNYSDSWNNYERDVSNTSSLKNWSLYKNPSGEYIRIWISNYVANEIKLMYQTIIDDEIYDIEESPRRDHE